VELPFADANPFLMASLAAIAEPNDFGGSFGGPVFIPKTFNGRHKLFFFVNYSGIYKRTPQTTSATVPTPAWEQGDFSGLLSVDAVKYTIYDPHSVQLVNGIAPVAIPQPATGTRRNRASKSPASSVTPKASAAITSGRLTAPPRSMLVCIGHPMRPARSVRCKHPISLPILAFRLT
jgi:hypothetical protein